MKPKFFLSYKAGLLAPVKAKLVQVHNGWMHQDPAPGSYVKYTLGLMLK